MNVFVQNLLSTKFLQLFFVMFFMKEVFEKWLAYDVW